MIIGALITALLAYLAAKKAKKPRGDGLSLPTQASIASWRSLNGGVSMLSPATSIVLAAAVKGESRSLRATEPTRLMDLFTATSMRVIEPGRLPSVDFTPSGSLLY